MTTRLRVPALVFGMIICGVLAPLHPISGVGSWELSPESVDLELMAEVKAWVNEPPTDVRASIRDRAESFQIFLSYYDVDTQARALEGTPYGASIRRAAEAHRVDPLLLAAIAQVESNFDPVAVSHRGAVGLVQVLPSTARTTAEVLLDPRENLNRGASYLRYLLERFGGDLELALAAYNAGPSNVRRYGGVPPFRETRRYVEKVLGIYVGHHREVWRTQGSEELSWSAPASERVV